MRRQRVAKKKVPAKKGGPSNKQLATRIKKLEHTEELKYLDTTMSSTWVDSYTVLLPCGIAQGDDYNERVGEEIIAKYINIKTNITTAIGGVPLKGRFIVFWDTQNNGDGPGLWSSSVGVGPSKALIDDATITKLYAPLNYRTKHRYTVLMDKIFNMNPQSTNTQQAKFIKRNLQLGGAKIKFSDSGATASSLPSRALYIYGFVPSSLSTYFSAASVNVRFWYTDA